ncbi:MAG: hypothetical protein ACOX22_06960 [Caldicoprobacterales bacterium]|nr:hypothetical protein [Clostridiales bacterium]
MWKVVYMAQSKALADRIQELLIREGFLIKLRAVYRNVPEKDNLYEILVPHIEAEEVHNILMEHGF